MKAELDMNLKEVLKEAKELTGVTLQAIGKAIGNKPASAKQGTSKRMTRGSFSTKYLPDIAEVLQLIIYIEMPDGRIIRLVK